MRVLMLDAGLPSGSTVEDLLAAALARRSIEMNRVSNPLQLESELHHTETQAVLIDVAIGSAEANNVQALLRMLREKHDSLAVIVLEGAGSDTARCAPWLDADVDDCFARTLEPVEAAARVAAAIRRTHRARQPRKLRCGDLVLDKSNTSASWRDNVIALTPREAAVLEVLMTHAGRVVSREVLHAALHGEDGVRGNTVEVYIHALRRKLQAGLIRTVRGAGYRLTEAARTDS